MYTVFRTNGFKKAFKKCIKRGLPQKSFEEVIDILREHGSLPPKYKPHKLSAKFDYAWECRLTPDWLLLWHQDDTELTLLLIDTGTHSDIFGYSSALHISPSITAHLNHGARTS